MSAIDCYRIGSIGISLTNFGEIRIRKSKAAHQNSINHNNYVSEYQENFSYYLLHVQVLNLEKVTDIHTVRIFCDDPGSYRSAPPTEHRTTETI